MKDSKVVEAIGLLNKEEREAFRLFIKSPYFHKGFTEEELLPFYEKALELLENPEQAGLSKERLHQLVFPEKSYLESRMDRLMFEMNRLVKVFLLTQQYHRDANEAQRAVDYSEVMRGKGVIVNLEKQIKKMAGPEGEKPLESLERFYNRFILAAEEHKRQDTFNKLKDDVGLPTVLKYLDMFYFSQRLEIVNRYLIQQMATTLEMPEAVRLAIDTGFIPKAYIEEAPILLILEKIQQLLMQKPPLVSGYQSLTALLKEHESSIEPSLLSEFYTYLRNYCVILIDNGYTEFVQVMHDLQIDNLKRGYFYTGGKIGFNSLLNITQTAIRLNRTSWVKKFLEEHKDRIIGENENRDFYRMNLALCFFAEKKYEEALENIPFGSSYSFYHVMSRRLELKTYYEMNSELLPSKIEAFKMYVSRAGRKSFSANLFELLTNFGNFVLQLSQSRPGDKKRSEQLMARIQSKKLVGERVWLMEKAKEIGESK